MEREIGERNETGELGSQVKVNGKIILSLRGI